jgi:hypothetical protein
MAAALRLVEMDKEVSILILTGDARVGAWETTKSWLLWLVGVFVVCSPSHIAVFSALLHTAAVAGNGWCEHLLHQHAL